MREYSQAVLSNIFWMSSTCVQGIAKSEPSDRVRYRATFTRCAELLRRCIATHEHTRTKTTGLGPLLEPRHYEEALIVGGVIRELWHPSGDDDEAILAHLAATLEGLAANAPFAEDATREVGILMSTLCTRTVSHPGPICGVPLHGTPWETHDD
ncbi:MAG TPA: hypothetical protein VMJ72_02010 [Candidatus Paceibacterota bacterium]|nr:hypothetical protein [Candidatus Paceibacterota bacterium]